MNEISIVDASKTLATYMGWKYFGFNSPESMANPKLKLGWYAIQQQMILHSPKAGFTRLGEDIWGKWKCRNHSELRFFNSWDLLYDVISRIENEDLSEYGYKWTDSDGETHYNNESVNVSIDSDLAYVEINLQLDPPHEIASAGRYDPKDKKEKVFWMLYEAVLKINEIKNYDESKNPA